MALGGALHQDVQACALTDLDHRQKPPYDAADQRIALEDTTRRFFLGVQWHPEHLDASTPLFEALVRAARA